MVLIIGIDKFEIKFQK